jgi:alkylhydroperoxidase family enzyme
MLDIPDGTTVSEHPWRRRIMQLHVQARMSNPALFVPGALQALLALDKSTQNADLPDVTRKLVHLRASQRLRRLRGHARARTQAGRRT